MKKPGTNVDFQEKPYVVGIDLGTTNCSVSYVDMAALRRETSKNANADKQPYLKIFNIPQLTGYGEFTKNPTLPSFLYIPGEYDISKEGLKHPWKKREDLFAGTFARDHGSKVPARLVSSAKSWLCNPEVDRTSRILPWGSEGVEKVSPVTATSEYLNHIKNAWNFFVKDEDQFLENQFVVITVPASFNEEARDLTLEAVRLAGLGGAAVTLIEEPLAAFYAWLMRHGGDWQQIVKPGELILVCDVGGGTTDFSLISLKESEGTPRFERIAVGDHLMLGGDNIDLSLARKIEAKFRSGTKLTSDKWKTLCHRCREAKENILENGETRVRITLKGEGRALIAGTLAADLTREDLESVIHTEFFPDVASIHGLTTPEPDHVSEFGLHYEKDPAVTRHIIRFLENHREDVRKSLSKNPYPDCVLFNGGALKPKGIQDRIVHALGKWFKVPSPGAVRILENPFPELAVGMGAAYYGLVKQGEGIRVGSGSPRSYYMGVSRRQGKDVRAICVIERGLDEGSVIDLSQMSYEVRTNEPVSFDLYSSSFRSGDVAGDIIEIDDSITAMMPIQTVIQFGKKSEKKIIPVEIRAEYTEMGSLSMYCRSMVSEHQWKLQFQLRQPNPALLPEMGAVYEEADVQKACDHIKDTFSRPDAADMEISGIAGQMEDMVGQKKNSWPLSFLRTLADQLIQLEPVRKLSAEHEVRWLNLVGFCMRPGFGDAFDSDRAQKLWKVYLTGMVFEKSKQNRLEWWIFIRRIAAGLKAGQQRQIFQDVSPFLIKNRQKKAVLAPQEEIELWMAIGNMERFLVKDKVVLAKSLMSLLKPGKKQKSLFWALSRLGARELLYGSADRVIPPKEVIRWIHHILDIPWDTNDPVEDAVVQIARKTGDRTRDVDDESRSRILSWLDRRNQKERYSKILTEKTPMAVNERSAQFGENLPTGLVLKD